MSKISLKPNREKSLFYRHPWIFSGALNLSPKEKIEDGEVVDIIDSHGNFLARGYYNSQSDIAVRILTFEDEVIDEDFFVKRLERAQAFRQPYLEGKQTNSYRLVFAESDGLPGLIVDRYNDGFVVQIHTLGMEKLKTLVVKALVKIFQPAFIYERSDVEVRRKEGLTTMPKGILFGDLSKISEKKLNNKNAAFLEIEEYGLKFLVDVVSGQKTGFFLDQRENRLALRSYVKGKRVLNLFCYSGGFSCHALAGGAAKVTSVDISEEAIALCKDNVELNGFEKERHEAVVADCFDYLESLRHRGEKFDVVVVDPPAFVKSRASIDNALKAYVRLNVAALHVLKPDGVLMSSSCSSYVTPEMFRGMLFQSALRAKTGLAIVEQRGQPFDHAMNVYFPEGEYLKFVVAQKRSF